MKIAKIGSSKKSQLNVKEADNKDSNSEIIKRKDIKNSPFIVITVEKGSFGTMGKYRITEIYETPEEVEEELKEITWNRIIQVIQLLTENK